MSDNADLFDHMSIKNEQTNWPQRQEIETVRENSCYETRNRLKLVLSL